MQQALKLYRSCNFDMRNNNILIIDRIVFLCYKKILEGSTALIYEDIEYWLINKLPYAMKFPYQKALHEMPLSLIKCLVIRHLKFKARSKLSNRLKCEEK